MENNVETLNDLIQINNDRIAGYEKAAGQTDESDLRSLFTHMADQSKQLVNELRQHVRSEGDKPAEGSTLKGKIYRTWMDVKATFGGDDRKSLLSSCEYGEDAAQAAYKSAIADKELTPDVIEVIKRQKSSLRESHDKIRNMRDAQPA